MGMQGPNPSYALSHRRQIGMSAGIFSTRLGSLLSPLVYILGNHSPGLQPVMFGLVPLLAAAAAS